MDERSTARGARADTAADVEAWLDRAEAQDDAARLQLLEDLYGEFESELDRDFGEAPSPRR